MRSRRIPFLRLAAMCGAAAMALEATFARAATVNIPLAGTFTAGVSGGGSASLTSASGNFKQWVPPILFIPGFHADFGVSAKAQTVDLNVTPVGATKFAASGSSNLTYDNQSPPTPQLVNSLSLDLNGASAINLDMTIDPIVITTGLGDFDLELKFDGQINSLDFISTGPSSLPGAFYLVPGNFLAEIQGKVTGKLLDVPLIGDIDLGELFDLAPTVLPPVAAALPGNVVLTDGSGGSGPYPATLLANYAFSLPGDLSFPLELPFEEHISASVPSGQSGFSKLDIVGKLNATLTLSNPGYSLDGSVPNGVIPEPSSFALLAVGLAGLAAFRFRRR